MTTALIGSGSGIIDLVFSKTIDAPDETIAFHYGNFDNAYGDGTVAAAAANGRVYADTTLPLEFGSIGTPTTASGQTTYTWTPPNATRPANVLLVAGGGGGGGRSGGGGGAGGLIYQPNQTLNSASYTIVVGQGGTGGAGSGTFGTNGKNSTGFGVTAIGGGGGASDPGVGTGLAGGSGGGGRYGGGGGTGTTGQGNNGGGSTGISTYNGGGGGGAGSIGETGTTTDIGDGGAGLFVGVFGETYGESGWFAGGGGGGSHDPWPGSASLGGIGGGGAGGTNAGGGTPGEDGDAHTGGGGGAGSTDSSNGGAGGSGGSGVVLVRYIMDNNLIFTLPYGSSPEFPVPSANYLVTNNISSVNGLYWIKPDGYSGEAFQVYCDLTGDESGIGSGGWMRVKYAADLYTQANPWKLTSGFAYSGDFTFTYTNEQINAMKATASEIRQTLDSYGKGSVGWTYNVGDYMGCKTLNGSIFNSTSAGGINLPTNTDYSFNGWNSSGVIEPRGTDPTDANDQVWRQGLIYLVESGNTYLPILGIYNRDVDAANEERYFPLVSGDETFIWIR